MSGKQSNLSVEPAVYLSSLIMIRDAVRAGGGVARFPISLVAGDVASGRLVRWGDVGGSNVALWALYPTRLLLSARVSAFLELLKSAVPDGAPEELAAYLQEVPNWRSSSNPHCYALLTTPRSFRKSDRMAALRSSAPKPDSLPSAELMTKDINSPVPTPGRDRRTVEMPQAGCGGWDSRDTAAKAGVSSPPARESSARLQYPLSRRFP